MLNSAVLTLAASMVVGQAEQPPSTYDHLKGLQWRVGRWIGESTADVDLPSVCKKGDKLTIRQTTEWSLGKIALLTATDYEISGKSVAQGVALVAWNGAKGEIETHYTDSLGSSIHGTWRKVGDDWISQERGVVGDGRKHSSKFTVSPGGKGDSFSQKITDRIFAEQQLPDAEVVFSRTK